MFAKKCVVLFTYFCGMGENSPFGLMLWVLQYWCRGDLAALLNQWVNTVNTNTKDLLQFYFKEKTCEKDKTELRHVLSKDVFANFLMSPGIDSRPGGQVQQPCLCRTGPPGYIGCRNRFLGIDSWAPYTFAIRAQDSPTVGTVQCTFNSTTLSILYSHLG
jgi:hypothetical protein